ncbi:MAG: DNA-binding domain-containing protein [Myxococcota bacterium]
MQRFPDLHGVQSLFWRLVTAPEGVGPGAAELRGRGDLSSEDLSFLVRPGPVRQDARLDPTERLDIYADMYFHRLRDCLAENFPKVAAQIGDSPFHNLVTDYLLAHPPKHYSLRELGRALPGFLETHALERSFPALADLARLEWARFDVFDDTDAVPLSRRDLLALDAGSAPETFAPTLIPSCRALRLDARVLPLWKHLDADEDSATDGASKNSNPGDTIGVRVWRKGFAVFHRSVPPDEESCLELLKTKGATLAQLGERLLEQQAPGASHAQVAQRFASLLDLWARDEVLTRGAPASTPGPAPRGPQ